MIQKGLRRRIGLLAVCWLYTLAGATAHAQAEKGPGKNMLWRVESAENVVYILGSVHALPKKMYPLNPAIEQAFANVHSVVFELNLDSIFGGGAGMMSMMKQGVFGGDTVLKKMVSRSTYSQVEKRLKKLGMDMTLFSKMKPWMVAFMLMGLDMQSSGMEAQYGIDFYFHKKANEEGKPVSGLETMQDQISVFASMPLPAQEAFLKQTLEKGGDSDKELKVITSAWKNGDTKALEKLLDEYLGSSGDLYEGLVFRRNDNWMPQIEALLRQEKPAMVVVGALHLVGKRGIIEMLRERGYRIEQL